MRKTRVGVICGGQSAEHEVSLASARSILGALDPDKYEPVVLGITHSGRWLTHGDALAQLSAGQNDSSVNASGLNASGVNASGVNAGEQPPANSRALATNGLAARELVPGVTNNKLPPLDVVFPVLHGPFGEDGTVQGLLELAGIPYVGSGVLASSVAMDKVASRDLFARHGLPQVGYCPVKRKQWEADRERTLAMVEAQLRYPVFVKPANLGSSIGVTKARDRAGLAAALDDAARYDRKLLVEEAVPDAREIECSVLGNDDPIASVPGEVVPSNEFYDYAAKYLDGRSELLIPAPLSPDKVQEVRELAVRAFLAIDGAGLARIDFLMNRKTGELFLNEINTMPGFTVISMYPKLWEATGIGYTELVDRLIELALERHADRARCATTYEGALPAGGE